MQDIRRRSARPVAADRARIRRTLGLVAGAGFLAVAVVWAGCAGEEVGKQPGVASRVAADGHGPDALLPGGSWIATAAVADVAVYAERGDDRSVQRLAGHDENGTPLVLLVDGSDASGAWLPVFLPVRPNGSQGWVRSRDVDLTQTQYRIEVELSAHRLVVRRDRAVVIESSIGVGKDSTPTPGGRYYVKELIQPTSPDSVYGPYVFGLSGFSDVLTSFAGDPDAGIAIHGNNDPGSIGRNVSHGCIRLPNEVVSRMTELIPLGTPVEIRA
jgi:lipoprotein-anchoring transpeptidase ErfK/SrfK